MSSGASMMGTRAQMHALHPSKELDMTTQRRKVSLIERAADHVCSLIAALPTPVCEWNRPEPCDQPATDDGLCAQHSAAADRLLAALHELGAS